MINKILKLEGAQPLTKKEQKSINGGSKNPEMCFCDSLGYTIECSKLDQFCPADM